MCRAGGGGQPVIVVCRSLRKDSDGDSAVLMNCPSRISCEPNTASAGERLRVHITSGSPDVERCKHVKSRATTVYFRLDRHV